jgi:hypothetical protein
MRSISSEGVFVAPFEGALGDDFEDERLFFAAVLGTDAFFAMLLSSFARLLHYASALDGALS